MRPVKRTTLSEQVVAQIKQYIVQHNLKPGDRLPTEQELADLLGVSRISVREATKSLSFLGIVQAAPRRGLTLGEVDMDRVTKYLGFHFALSGYSKLHLLQARMVIEIGSLPFAMERMDEDPGVHRRLMELIEKLDQAKTPDEFIEGDIVFHRALVEGSGIEPLVAFTDLLHVFFREFRESVVPEGLRSGNQSHRRIVEALRNHRPETAQKELRLHLGHYRKQL